mmetsp:Transcript_14222/g.24190  ORF Transcript_14222/g.24190 Transcript_14222/m.24190 type:complete len:464 (-) Transcript_14222:23-1414(-)
MAGLWSKLVPFFPEHPRLGEAEVPADTLLPPIYRVSVEGDAGLEMGELRRLPSPLGALHPQPFLSKVRRNERLTEANHFQDTRLIVLDAEALPSPFAPGDVAVLQPRNDESTVEQLLEKLGLKGGDRLKIEVVEEQLGQVSQSSLLRFPEQGVSARELFSYWLNLLDPPSRHFLRVLSFFVDEQVHKAKLIELGSNTVDGKSEYQRYCVREKRTVLEVLLDFYPQEPRFKLPLAYLIQLCGPQRPREFSISSAGDAHPSELHLTMAVVEYHTPFKRLKRGVCSYWLRSQTVEGGAESDPVPLWIKKGTMTLPPGESTPLLMVGPGTGVAAFRSFIQSRSNAGRQMVLVFGCRSRTKDYYYEEEWKRVPNLTVLPAFSRDSEDGAKSYVQHQIRANAEMVGRLVVEQGAWVYVSGRAKLMPKSVEKALEAALQHAAILPLLQGLTPAQYITAMKKERRYQQEVW